MINCIIVDDEPLARELLESYIEQLPELHLIGYYASAVEAFSALHQQQVDILFLDIEMPGITGLSLVRSLKAIPKVIFVTAYTEHAVDAFELEAVDYLVKPVTFERFLKAAQKVISINAGQASAANLHVTTHLFLKVDRRLVKVDLPVILYIEALGDYLKVHTDSQTYITYMTLVKIQTLLPNSFIRIHRSTIINSAHIRFIEGNKVSVSSKVLPIGQSYREDLFRFLS